MQLAQIATFVDGRLIGDPNLQCTGANPPHQAASGEITMLDDPRRYLGVRESGAIAVITAVEIEDLDLPQIIVASTHDAFTKIVAHFRPPIDESMLADGIDPSAEIDDSAYIHPSAVIGAGAKIGARTRIKPGAVVMPHCQIGDDCVLFSNVTLYEYTQLADRVVLHSGVVIGAHGFGYRQKEGRHEPTAQLGYVAIDSDVEIGAGTTVDRGTYGPTTIGEGTKIDNQVMIGHNCQIGRHNLICSQVGIAGSSSTGDYVVLAGQVGLKDHIKIGNRAVIAAQAGVMADCKDNEVYLGSPATTQRDQMQIIALQRRLPEMRRELKLLRRQIDALTAEQSAISNQSQSEISKNRENKAA